MIKALRNDIEVDYYYGDNGRGRHSNFSFFPLL